MREIVFERLAGTFFVEQNFVELVVDWVRVLGKWDLGEGVGKGREIGMGFKFQIFFFGERGFVVEFEEGSLVGNGVDFKFDPVVDDSVAIEFFALKFIGEVLPGPVE